MIFEPELCALAATAFSIYVCTRIMLLVMCACVVHARQVIPYLQESTIYENLTGEVAAVCRFEEYLPLAS